ncbi:hypothetical protein EDB85DRAFT_2140311 [Lactarius pseudohatsudake]|nr:hypothetical protein EDB85DRAFT_2140311 [Lactarius pseudohatsudake]
MSLQPLFHSLHHWYYPPLVDDIMADLETTARGYLEHLDTFRPTKEFERSLDKKENKKNNKAGRMAKKARMSTASQIPWLESVELRRLTGAGMAPEWFLKTQDVWIHAMNHVSHLELASSMSPYIRQVVLYYLNSYHAFEEIKEMECIQFPTTFEKGWRGQEMYVYMIAEMWDASGGNTNFKFFENKKMWRNLLWAVCEVVMGWGGFNGWDWGGFSNVRTLSINVLSAQDFYRLSVCLLVFFIRSFVTCLGHYPSPMLLPPSSILPLVLSTVGSLAMGWG